MANLPEDHLEPIAASTDDYCGPFTIREGKKEMKGYRVVFTSLASRTVHHNTSSKLETDAFINALHHFICQRGQIQFVQAKHELKAAVAELDDKCVRKELLQENCYWITFVMNVLSSSHKAGVWEQQIQSIQNNLSPLLPSADKFCRKHWGHVQHLANNFLTGCSKSIYLRVSYFSSVRNGQRQGETC